VILSSIYLQTYFPAFRVFDVLLVPTPPQPR